MGTRIVSSASLASSGVAIAAGQKRAHAAGIRTGVAVKDSLVILRQRQGQIVRPPTRASRENSWPSSRFSITTRRPADWPNSSRTMMRRWP